MLTINYKRSRVTISKESLEMFSRNSNEFLRHFVTVDEMWIHHNTPETKEQSKQWAFPGERAPKKAKMSLSTNKVMAMVFWDACGVTHIDYLKKVKAITGEYYSKLLDRSDIEAKTTAFGEKKCCYELLPHPAYSPDLAPCDYFLSPNLKKWLGGKRFGSNEEVITETNAYFEGLDKTYYLEGIKQLEKRWTKCIELKVDYVEK
ncbi:histone-lysine N-methyltransferase SETMAR-like [Euwallacea similis]|uniref:histone-lysine N-methyltransferase SETMAR-like n=1 Tax=Euwallacea similis TaxID=1736056 RepID=UPI00344D9EE8